MQHGLADLDEGRKVQNGDRAVSGEHLIQAARVADIAHLQRTPLNEFPMAIGQVVIGHGQKPRLRQAKTGVGAHIAGAARDQDCLHATFHSDAPRGTV